MNSLDILINDRYHLIRKLGEGGMGEVYLADDPVMQRQVALKFIRGPLGDNESYTRLLERFQREARTLAKLSHPNIVHVHDFGTHEGRPYLVMEYLPGGSLAERMGTPMPWQEACQLAATVARALAFAHSEGVLHRDIKPSNILFTKGSEPVVTDFGLAKVLDPGGGEGDSTASLSLIGAAQALGTPAYMAPEQWSGQSTEQSDIYSLGVVLFQMLTGQVPYPGKTPGEVVTSLATNSLKKPRAINGNIPRKLETIVQKALARDPGARFGSMEALAKVITKLGNVENADSPRFTLPKMQKQKPAPLPSRQPSKSPHFPVGKVLPFALVGIVLIVIIIGISTRWFGLAAVPTYSPPVEPITATETTQPEPTNTSMPAKQPTKSTVPPTPTVQRLGIGSKMTGKDGMVMVYVPGGTFTMGSEDGYSGEKPPHQVTLDAFWIDQTEVTNAMYADFLNQNGNKTEGGTSWLDKGDSKARIYRDGETWDVKNGYENHPVTDVTWYGANAYCQWTERELPTEAQWEYAARGTDGRSYPWGSEPPTCERANHHPSSGGYCVGDTSEVGNHTAGISPFGAIDLAGNVWEWVADWYDESYYSSTISWINPTGPAIGKYKVLRGGSWNYEEYGIRSFHRFKNNPSFTYIYNGFRCSDSETESIFPESTLASTPVVTTENDPSNLEIDSGQEPPSENLGIDSTWVSPKDGMALVYVPAGEFTMGSTSGYSDELPQHKVTLDAFWIDQTEVTNALYAKCVAADKCTQPSKSESQTRKSYYGNPLYVDYPVIYVNWSQANDYCLWAGRELPTEAQWEYAARGTNAQKRPWGDEPVTCERANYSNCVGDTLKVGSYTNGQSPFSVYDMAGNVYEWVADWYDENYYSSITDWNNPPGPTNGDYKVLRGGCWYSNLDFVRSADRYKIYPDNAVNSVGFRCVRNIDITP